jgi:GT2 family glycosyltransferase/glycosyltransferase involved in cell wall biosynthesis
MGVVLLVSYSGSLGGAERALIDFAPALDGELWLACPEGPLAERARAAGIAVLPLARRPLGLRSQPLLAASRMLAFRRQVRAFARDLDPAMVVACGMRAALALLLPAPSQPVVFTHHDLLPGLLLGRVVRAAAARAELVIVPSRTVARDLGPRIPAVVIHPGVDVERFDANGAAPADPPHALVLGALVEWKRPELALSALALARRERPDLRLRIVGAPLDDDDTVLWQLRERASRPDLAGAVDIVGAVDHPESELARATCLLHCAPREPYGLAVVEALAAGRPVIAPAAAGPQEIVDETCGVLYPPGDAAAAAGALLEVVGDPHRAASLGQAGRARARERFGVVQAREQFAEALSRLATRVDRPRPSRGDSLTLVTVTHNSAPELGILLASVASYLPRAQVIVVDCASSEPVSVPAGVELIALNDNVGFGRACNVGVRQAREPVTALVNPDVVLLDGSLAELAEEALRGPARLLAPLVLSPDGARQDTVHAAPTSLRDLAGAVIPRDALGPWRSRRPRRVGWAVGCALVARTDTLAALGPFDERIFMYGEDLELGLRAAAGGVETWFWPSARVLHKRAHATAAAFGGEPFELLAQARHDAVQRRLGPRRARIDLAAQAVTFASRIAVKRALGRTTSREQAQLHALRAIA